MPYDHSTKIGNQGDLLKHAVLYAVIRHLLGGWPSGKVFKYVEGHAGRPQYVLPQGGKWTHGIGAFSRLPGVAKGRKSAAERERVGPMLPYFEGIIGRKVTVGSVYPGSAGIAFRLLREAGVQFRMDLHETDVSAADDLRRYFSPWLGESVHVHAADGYSGVRAVPEPSLVLLDPHDLRLERITECVNYLSGQELSFLCWTPRSSDQPRRESANSVRFIEAVRGGCACFPVSWAKWRKGQTSGCCLTASKSLEGIVRPVVEKCVGLMQEVKGIEDLPRTVRSANEDWRVEPPPASGPAVEACSRVDE